MLTAGVGGPLTGRGADVLIIDDPIKNAEEAHCDTYRERTWDWYRSVAYTRLEPRGSVIVIATRWHEDDLIGRLIRAEPTAWRLLSLPALAEEDDSLGRPPGAPLWPDRYPAPVLEETRRVVGEYYWSAQYQQRPTPAGGRIFKREWFRTFVDLADGYQLGETLIPKSRCRRFCTVDLAVSTKTSADFTVIATWAVTPANDLLLVDLVRDRLEAPDILPALRRVYDEHRPAQIRLLVSQEAKQRTEGTARPEGGVGRLQLAAGRPQARSGSQK